SAADMKLSFVGLADLLADVDEEALGRLPDPQRRGIEAALLRVEGEAEGVNERAVSAGVLNVLQGAAAAGPLLVTVDDLQWLDPPSARALAFALRRMDRTLVRFIGVERLVDGSPTVTPSLGLPREWIRDLYLTPLSVEELDRLLELHLATPMLGSLVSKLHKASGG